MEYANFGPPWHIFCRNIAERSGNINFISVMTILSNRIINYLQTCVVDMLLVVKGWRQQLAALRKNGSKSFTTAEHFRFQCESLKLNLMSLC